VRREATREEVCAVARREFEIRDSEEIEIERERDGPYTGGQRIEVKVQQKKRGKAPKGQTSKHKLTAIWETQGKRREIQIELPQNQKGKKDIMKLVEQKAPDLSTEEYEIDMEGHSAYWRDGETVKIRRKEKGSQGKKPDPRKTQPQKGKRGRGRPRKNERTQSQDWDDDDRPEWEEEDTSEPRTVALRWKNQSTHIRWDDLIMTEAELEGVMRKKFKIPEKTKIEVHKEEEGGTRRPVDTR
jgi:hypothetical protein